MRYKIRSSTKDFSRKKHHHDNSITLKWMVDISGAYLQDPLETFKAALLCKDTLIYVQSVVSADFAPLAVEYAK